MKKGLFTVIFGLFVCSLTAFGFVACGSGNSNGGDVVDGGGSNSSVIEECSHTYSDWTVKTAATCTEKGEEVRACTECGEEQTQEIAALGHDYSETGTNDESEHYHVCMRENCGEKSTYDEIDKNDDYACDICGENLTVKLRTDLVALVGDGEADSVDVSLNLAKNASSTMFEAIAEGLTNAKDGSVNLTLCGVETIPDQAFAENAKLKSVTLGDGVKTIGVGSFGVCSSLESVTLGKDLKTINQAAFYGNPKLKSIAIPDNVTSLGDSVFYQCAVLENASIGSGIDAIGMLAFSGCASLQSITIPTTITTIGDCAFASTGLTSIVIPGTVTTLGEGVFQKCKKLTSVTLGGGITTISKQLFWKCEALTNISLPSNIITIGERAFANSGLTEIALPSGVTEIGEKAFYGCAFSNVTIPNSVTNIGDEAFNMCKWLTEIVVPDSVTEFGVGVFEGCEVLKNVTIGSGIASIRNMFEGCISLENVTFRAPITSFYIGAFRNLTTENITLTFAEGQKKLTATEAEASEFEAKEDAEYLYGGTEFCGYTFKEIIVPHLVKIKATRYMLPSELQSSLENYASKGATNFELILAIDANNDVFEAIVAGLANANDGSINLTLVGAETISAQAFYQNTKLKSVTFGSGVKTIGSSAFAGSSLTSVNIGDDVESIGEGVFSSSELTSVVIPDTVTSLGAIAFSGCEALLSATIGSGISVIESVMFQGCTSLKTVTFCGNSKIESIDECAFSACTALENITIPTA